MYKSDIVLYLKDEYHGSGASNGGMSTKNMCLSSPHLLKNNLINKKILNS